MKLMKQQIGSLKINKATIFFFTIFVAFFIALLMINCIVSLANDDIAMSPLRHSFLRSFIGAVGQVYAYYIGLSGRVTATFIRAFFLLGNDIFIINIIQSLMAVCLSYLVFLHAYLRHPKKFLDGFVLIFIFGLIWFFPDYVGEVLFSSKTISIFFFWGTTLTLYFIYYYRLLVSGKDNIPDTTYARVVFFISGILLGMWLENLSVTIAIFLLTICFYLKFLRKKIKTWSWLGCVGYIIGTTILIIAPGNYNRIAISGGYRSSLLEKVVPLAKKIFYHYMHRIKDPSTIITHNILAIENTALFFVNYIIPMLIFTIFVGAIIKFKRCKTFFIFFALAMLSAFAMIGSTELNFYGRTAFVSDIFMIIAIISLIPSFLVLLPRLPNVKLMFKIALGGFGIIIFYCLIVSMIDTYEAYRVHYIQNKAREKWIHKNLSKGNKDILVSSIYLDPYNKDSQDLTGDISIGGRKHNIQYKGKGKYYFGQGVTNDISDGTNMAYSRYYKLNTIKLVSAKDVISYDFIKNYTITAGRPFVVIIRSNKVYYINTKHSCSDINNKTPFFLRVYPKFARNASKAHSLHFTYDSSNQAMVLSDDFKKPVNNVCVFVARLPFYPISKIKTGQYKGNTIYWEKDIHELDEAGQGNFNSSKLSDWWNSLVLKE